MYIYICIYIVRWCQQQRYICDIYIYISGGKMRSASLSSTNASFGSSFSSTSNAPTPAVALPSRKNSNAYSMEYLYLNMGEGQRAGSRSDPPHATRHAISTPRRTNVLPHFSIAPTATSQHVSLYPLVRRRLTHETVLLALTLELNLALHWS
jgi:hypothetical protein